MNGTGTEQLSSEAAAQLLVWAMDELATATGVELDPVKARRLARSCLEGRTSVELAPLAAGLLSALEASRLAAVDAGPLTEALERAPLPLLTLSGGGLVITARRGDQVELGRPGQGHQWVPMTEALSLLGAQGHWLSVSPATPLEALAHHPSPWARLRGLMHLERDDLWVIFVYAAAVGLFTLATPIAVQALVSSVAFGTLLQPIVVLSALLLGALGFQATLSALQGRVVESLHQRFFVRTALDLAWRLPRVRTEARERGFGPEAVNRFFEVVTAQKTAGVLLTDGIATVLQISIGLLVLGFYHPALLALDLVLVVLVALVVFAPARVGLSTSLDESAAKYEVAAWLEQLALAGAAFRGKAAATFASERADALTRRYLSARGRHFRVVFGQTLGVLGLHVLTSATLLGVGGWLVVQRELTLGQLVAAEIIVAAVTSSVAKLGKLLDSAYDLLTSVHKLGHLLDVELEAAERGELVPGQGPLRVEVHAAHDGVSAPLTLEVGAGERVAISGARGHRLGEWLAALRLPVAGTVSFNAVDTSSARTPALRDQVALVRRGELFEGTVLENVTLGRDTVTALEARAALDKVGLLEELRALPEGIDTHLFHSGAPLSPSQQLRLSVARALAAVPRLIVVDESLEGIEPTARSRCIAALTRPGAPWTLVALVNEPGAALARACSTHHAIEALAAAGPEGGTR